MMVFPSGASQGMERGPSVSRKNGNRDSGVQVLNLSLGCSTADGQAPMVLERAIAQLTPTMAVVAAAGNHGTDKLDDTITSVLNDIDAQLTTKDLQDLNKRADIDKEDPDALAEEWLKDHGFLK